MALAMASAEAAHAAKARNTEPASLAVMNFYDLSQDSQWSWLSKGLADLLIGDLAKAGKFQIVDREQLQVYLDELQFNHSGFVADQRAASKLGSLAKVEKVLMGKFLISPGDRISIEVLLVAVNGNRLERVEKIEGKASEVLALEKKLAVQVLKNLNVPITERERQAIATHGARSLDAIAHYYQGLDHYDRGNTELALAEIDFSARIDPGFLPARYFAGRIYGEISEYRHAEVEIKESLSVFREQNSPSYWTHAALILAKNYHEELNNTPEAIRLLEQILADSPHTLEGRNARFLLADYSFRTRQYSKAYTHYSTLTSLNAKRYGNSPEETIHSRNRLYIPYRSIHLKDAYDLKRDSINKSRAAYLNAFFSGQETGGSHPEIRLVDSASREQEVVVGLPELKRLAGNFEASDVLSTRGYTVDYDQVFHIPRGHLLRKVTVTWEKNQSELSVQLYQIYGSKREFRLGGVLGPIGSEVNRGKQVDTYDFSAVHQEAVGLTLYVPTKHTSPIRIQLRFELIPANATKWKVDAADYWKQGGAQFYKYPIILPTGLGGAEKLNFLQDRAGKYWIIYDNRNAHAASLGHATANSKIWLYHSEDGEKWTGPQLVARVNSSGEDYMPSLIQDESRRFRLAWISDRTDGRPQVWVSESADGVRWRSPRRLPLSYANPAEPPARPRLLRVIQARDGVFWLVFFDEDRPNRLFIASSPDAVHWTPARPLTFDPAASKIPGEGHLTFFQDRNGIFRLIYHYGREEMYLGSSRNGWDWEFRKSTYRYSHYSAAMQDEDGRFVILMGGGSCDTSGYTKTVHQAWSQNWWDWSYPISIASPDWYANLQDVNSEILRSNRGSYWVLARPSHAEELYLFRLAKFPAQGVSETYQPRGGLVPPEMKREMEQIQPGHPLGCPPPKVREPGKGK